MLRAPQRRLTGICLAFALVLVFVGTVTKLIMKFDLPSGTNVIPSHNYKFVWHCHILEHEDNEMMRPYDVVG